jgi:AcrR family transcriptional regulator
MDPRTRRSRQALHRAFLELLEIKPLEQITIRDIADKSGVGYTTFFRHHPNKEAMLNEIVTAQIERLLALSIPVLDKGDLRAASTAIFSYVNDHRRLWSTLLTGGAAPLVREEFLRLGRDAASVRLPPSNWVPADIGLALIVSGTIELMTLWLRQPDPLPTKRIVEIYNCIVVSPPLEANRFQVRRKKAGAKSSSPSKGRTYRVTAERSAAKGTKSGSKQQHRLGVQPTSKRTRR